VVSETQRCPLTIVAKPRPSQVDPLDILRPPPLPSSVLRDIKPKPKSKSKNTIKEDRKIKKEPLFLSYIDDEAIESSADESDDTMSEEGKAFIDDGDIDSVSRRNKHRPRPRPKLGKGSPVPSKKILKRENSVELESSTDEMDGIESVPDEVADLKAKKDDVNGFKPEDDSMSGIESVDDVESVSAQLDDIPRNRPRARRPHRALEVEFNLQNRQPIPKSGSDSSSESGEDEIMLENEQPKTHAYAIRRDQPKAQSIERQQDVDMADGRPDEENESDNEDDLDIMKYVRHPTQAVNTEVETHTSRRPERVYSPSPATSFDSVCNEEPFYEDDDDCELTQMPELKTRLTGWYTDAG